MTKQEDLNKAQIFLTREQLQTHSREMDYPYSTEAPVKRGLVLGTKEPWSGWKNEAYELAKHLNDPQWQERINIFQNRPGGSELLAAAKARWERERPIIFLHPDGT